jgi:hypothetical protein
MDCSHLGAAQDAAARSEGCEECLKTGQKWFALCKCLTCGHVGCCDASPGKHARGHFHETGHPLVEPLRRGNDWTWCFIDCDYVDRSAA